VPGPGAGQPRNAIGLGIRFAWLLAGLIGFGVGLALLVRAKLGLDPWDVLNQGIARHLGIQIGWVVDIVGAIVLLAWIPLKQRPGAGTICNIIVIGLVVNVALDLLPNPKGLPLRVAMLATGILLNGLSTGCYIGAGLGPGPRDGLMTGFAARGHSVRVVRTAIELTVLGAGFVLGGSVGFGTVAYAVSIGPLVHFFLPRLSLTTPGVGMQGGNQATCNP
jgi:uncharacterized membrane protein YczE